MGEKSTPSPLSLSLTCSGVDDGQSGLARRAPCPERELRHLLEDLLLSESEECVSKRKDVREGEIGRGKVLSLPFFVARQLTFFSRQLMPAKIHLSLSLFRPQPTLKMAASSSEATRDLTRALDGDGNGL